MYPEAELNFQRNHRHFKPCGRIYFSIFWVKFLSSIVLNKMVGIYSDRIIQLNLQKVILFGN
jgi:hypothetical protein